MKYQAENAVSSFFYYMWNAWSEEECRTVFKEMYPHFWEKWSLMTDKGVFGASERFYAELTDHYREKLVVAVTNSPKHDFNRCKSATCRFLFRDTKSARDKNGTKPRKNKVKDTSPEISLVEYLCFVCKGTNLSLEKRGEIPISLIHNSFSYHCTPNVVIANGFDLKQHDLRKSGVKFCFAL